MDRINSVSYLFTNLLMSFNQTFDLNHWNALRTIFFPIEHISSRTSHHIVWSTEILVVNILVVVSLFISIGISERYSIDDNL